MLTDSGGFQVFFAAPHDPRGRRRGLTFRSVYDGEPARSRPRRSPPHRRCSAPTSRCVSTSGPPADAPLAAVEESVRLTNPIGGAPAGGGPLTRQLVFGIRTGWDGPGSPAPRSIEEMTGLDFDGHPLGGLAIGEDR